MTDRKQPGSSKKAKGDRTFDFGYAIAIGVSLGFIFGTAFGNAAMGLTIGLLLATLANAIHEKRQGKKNANVALVIIIIGLLFVILMWVASALRWF
jgi:hypothetical protein